MTTRLAVVGGGRMGEALVTGLLRAGWAAPGEILVVEPVADRRKALLDLHPGLRVAPAMEEAEGAVLAVKPGDVEAACRAVAASGTRRVLSIAAGVPLARLEGWPGGGGPVV